MFLPWLHPSAAVPKTGTLFFARCMWTALVCGLFAMAAQAQGLQAIERLDVPRYMGVWYEIAKFPNRFQRQCVSDTRAEYRVQSPGRLRVLNSCRLATGQFEEALGEARQVGAPDSPKLQVRFAPAWLSWLPAVWGDYWVIDLEGDYQLVAVSEPRREYLWVLSRQPQVDALRYARLLERLKHQGLAIDRLEMTPQRTHPQ